MEEVLLSHDIRLDLMRPGRPDGDPLESARRDMFSTVLQWLLPHDFFQRRHRAIFGTRQEGTGNWLLQDSRLQSWMSSPCASNQDSTPRVLYLSGPAGSGKTVLSSILVKNLESIPSRHCQPVDKAPRVAVAVIYCNQLLQQERKYTTATILASIYTQLLLSPLGPRNQWYMIWGLDPGSLDLGLLFASNVLRMATNRNNMSPQNLNRYPHGSEDFVSEILDDIRVTAIRYQRLYIVIDGLDEFERGVQKELVEALEYLEKRAGAVKLFFTGSNDGQCSSLVRDWFPECLCIQMDVGGVDADIRRFLRMELDTMHALEYDPTLKEEAIEKITALSNGRILLAKNNLHILKQCKTVRSTLDSLPGTLTTSYDWIMQIISSQTPEDYELAMDILMWTLMSFKVLTHYELCNALASQKCPEQSSGENSNSGFCQTPSWTEMIRVCHGFITVDSGFVEFSHWTVRDYLDKQRSTLFPNGHTIMANACISYFVQGAFQPWGSFQDTLNANPLLVYASRYWGDHSRLAESKFEAQDLIIKFFAQENPKLKLAMLMKMVQDRFRPPEVPPSPEIWYSDAMLDLNVDDNISKDEEHDAMQREMASSFGLVEAVSEILTKESRGSGLEPLRVTASQSIFGMAAANGHWELADFVLSMDCFSPEIADVYGQTPLHYAAMEGDVGFVERLLQYSDAHRYLYLTTNRGHTTLHLAAMHGHIEVLRVLLRELQKDVEIGRAEVDYFNAPDYKGGTPLLLAIVGRHDGVVDLLLSFSWVDVHSGLYYDRKPLEWACIWGNARVVDTLLSRSDNPGATVNQTSWPSARTPLWWASGSGNISTVETLLKYGANPNTIGVVGTHRGEDGKTLTELATPIALAAHYGHWEILSVLLAHKDLYPNIEFISPLMNTRYAIGPIWWAVTHGCIEALRILVDNGYDPSTPDGPESALHIAVREGHTEILQFLLSLPNIDPHGFFDMDSGGRIRKPLQLAIALGSVSHALLLAERNPHRYTWEEYMAMLKLTVTQGNVELTSLLLLPKFGKHKWYGASSNPILNIAAQQYRNVEVLELLLQQPGVDINCRSTLPLFRHDDNSIDFDMGDGSDAESDAEVYGKTALMTAAQIGDAETVEFLLAQGADVNLTDFAGNTALLLAVLSGRYEVVEKLLSVDGINPNHANKHEQTALQLAAKQGSVDIARLLLARPDIMGDGYAVPTPLSEASQSPRSLGIFKLLLARTDININSKAASGMHHIWWYADSHQTYALTPLARAVDAGHTEVVRLLLERPEIDLQNEDLPDTYSPLALAAHGHYLEIVMMLLSRGCNPNSTSVGGFTPLMLAAASDAAATVKHLLSLANPPVRINETAKYLGVTAVHLAISLGSRGAFEVLISRNDLKLDIVCDGATPLIAAVKQQDVYAVRLLLARDDVDPNTPDEQGNTPLLWAVELCHKEIITLLGLHPKVDVWARNMDDIYPLKRAKHLGDQHRDFVLRAVKCILRP